MRPKNTDPRSKYFCIWLRNGTSVAINWFIVTNVLQCQRKNRNWICNDIFQFITHDIQLIVLIFLQYNFSINLTNILQIRVVGFCWCLYFLFWCCEWWFESLCDYIISITYSFWYQIINKSCTFLFSSSFSWFVIDFVIYIFIYYIFFIIYSYCF